MNAFLREVNALLTAGETLVLAAVADSSGSTPRSSGARMAVRRDRTILGTVGGGMVEAESQRLAAALFDDQERSVLMAPMNLTSELAAGTDMICGGKLTIILERVEPGGKAAKLYARLGEALRSGQSRLLLTRLRGPEPTCADHTLVQNPDDAPADLPVTAVTPLLTKVESGGMAMAAHGEDTLIAEGFVPPPALILFGGGHVSRATAVVAATLGFRLVVVDDRAEFANAERFPMADEIRVTNDFGSALAGLTVTGRDFILIITRGHLHDKTVLGLALDTPARYVGMIGSKKKRDAIYRALLDEGTTQAAIDRCHCPVGLAIGAQTPEEIAVSIAAQLIQVRAGHNGTRA
jgi:xanthine dehydrogenase accessory factor